MKRICFVEDDPNYADIVARFYKEVPKLFGGGAELIALQTISMLRHVLATNSVQLIILDLTLPDSMQEDTIEMIGRERKTLPPVFVLTGDHRIEVRQQCIAMGAVGVAIKEHVIESPNFFFATVYNEYLKALGHG